MDRVLVVDDNLATLKQIGHFLRDGYDVMLAKSGEMALSIAGRQAPDLVLLDIEMPGLDGFETFRRLKADPQRTDVPVIFLTGNQDRESELQALRLGAKDFITKPVNRGVLLHRLKTHLRLADYETGLKHMIADMERRMALSFAHLTEYRNRLATGHVERVALFLGMLGRRLQEGPQAELLPEDELGLIVRASPFHDIGKIAISDAVLQKGATLTAEEEEVLRRHPVIGAKILRGIRDRSPVATKEFFNRAAQLAEGHHERYDGKGYPAGLAGEDIPLGCRMLALAERFDEGIARGSDRAAFIRAAGEEVALLGGSSVKSALVRVAREFVGDNRGTLFDPLIADVFIADVEPFVDVLLRERGPGSLEGAM
ncbi:MAG: response regulator [Desulfovibrio sp.]|jgi:putative two-component system response regulator|nr:response regulator [Desulfovibrio sp.]